MKKHSAYTQITRTWYELQELQALQANANGNYHRVWICRALKLFLSFSLSKNSVRHHKCEVSSKFPDFKIPNTTGEHKVHHRNMKYNTGAWKTTRQHERELGSMKHNKGAWNTSREHEIQYWSILFFRNFLL